MKNDLPSVKDFMLSSDNDISFRVFHSHKTSKQLFL